MFDFTFGVFPSEVTDEAKQRERKNRLIRFGAGIAILIAIGLWFISEASIARSIALLLAFCGLIAFVLYAFNGIRPLTHEERKQL